MPMSTTAIVMLSLLLVLLVGVIVYAVALHHKSKSNFGDGLPGVVVGGFIVILLQIGCLMGLVVSADLSHIPSGTYTASDTELAYSPGSIDPTDVTVDGKSASVDAIQVDTSLKEPLVVVKEDKVTILVPSRDYFASETKSGQ